MWRFTTDEIRATATHIVEGRLGMLTAITAATGRYAEVVAAVAGAEDRAAARAAVRELLGVDETAARAVLDLRWEDLHEESCQAFDAERDALAAELARRRLEPADS
ncbi:hypothetical protein ACL02T_28840 [Pseudonocardia sp. RS010]|uniref:hypothetical protein n=1 Tax=Pseudonocardia sp. RS010 TaxID=3385979 RepID=UPI0039A0C599